MQDQSATTRRGAGLAGTVALLVAMLALGACVWAYDGWRAGAATGAWHPLNEAQLKRTEVGAARIGSSIYVVGGFVEPSITTDIVERYEIGRNRWRRAESMPIAVNHPAVASHRGFLYVYGGYTDSSFGPATPALQRFNPRSGHWKLMRPSRTSRAAAALAARDGKLYAVGGAADDALTKMEIYDVATGRWRSAPRMATPREHIAAVATVDGIYVFGGRSSAGELNTVERFDPESRRWSQLPPLQTPRSGIAAVAVDDRPVVFGGEELTPDGTTIPSVELFNPDTRSWETLPSMRTPRHGLGGAAMGRRIYALEGGPHPGYAFSAAIEFLDVPRGD